MKAEGLPTIIEANLPNDAAMAAKDTIRKVTAAGQSRDIDFDVFEAQVVATATTAAEGYTAEALALRNETEGFRDEVALNTTAVAQNTQTVQGLHDTVVSDAAQVALDRIATGQDAAQTALDRIATGQDAQTATTKAGDASDSAAAANTSKNYASGYADAAEQAKIDAEAARDASIAKVGATVTNTHSEDVNNAAGVKLVTEDYVKAVEMIAPTAAAPSPVIPTGTTKTYEFNSSGVPSYLNGTIVKQGDSVNVLNTDGVYSYEYKQCDANAVLTNEINPVIEISEYVVSDSSGNVIFKIASDGLKAMFYNITDGSGNVVATLKKELLQLIFADKDDGTAGSADSNYKGEFIIADENGNIIAKVDADGIHGAIGNTLTFEEISETIAKVSASNTYANVFFRESKVVGKSGLAIGDSLTAAGVWNVKAEILLGCEIDIHALGGIGLVQMVDGGTNTNGTIAALASADVAGKDFIAVLGPYNNRSLMATIGAKTDMYPTQSTLWGQMNYFFKRVYEELAEASNTSCKIFFAGIHAYGANEYVPSVYDEYPVGSGFNGQDYADKLKEICKWNGVQYIDLFANSGINSYTWGLYGATPTDKLHCSTAGYNLIGNHIASEINIFFND